MLARMARFFCLVLSVTLLLEPAILSAQDSGAAAAQASAASAAQTNTSSSSSSLGLPSAPAAQFNTTPATPSAPVPMQIRTAKAIFIANAGDKTDLFPDVFSGGPDRPYVQFYSAMEKWGHYQIVSTPEQADLIFSVGVASPSAAEIAPPAATLAPGTARSCMTCNFA